MASPPKEGTEMEEDLINLHVTSPELPRSSKFCSLIVEDDPPNLIDSELPVLESKLLKTENSCLNEDINQMSVNVEDILISLDMEDPKESAHKTNSCSSDLILDILADEPPYPTSPVSCEALDVLAKLDELLNETLRSSNKLLFQEGDCNEDISDTDLPICTKALFQEPDIVEESTSAKGQMESIETSKTDDENSQSLSCVSDEFGFEETDNKTNCEDEDADIISSVNDVIEGCCSDSNSNQKVEEIQIPRISVTTDSGVMNFVNSDDEDSEQTESIGASQLSSDTNELSSQDSHACESVQPENNQRHRVTLKRALSNCGGDRGGNFKRNNRWRATVGAPSDVTPLSNPSIGELPRSAASDRISAAGVESDEEIDWSWVHDIAREVTLERRAHVTGDYGTGSLLVEPLQTESENDHCVENEERSSAEEVVTECSTDDQLAQDTSWQRNSMRRIQHLRLPSDQTPSTDTTDSPVVETESQQQLPPQLNSTPDNVSNSNPITRPVSAPSRLATHSTVATQSSVRDQTRSRSRNDYRDRRERARSSSASSRSRRLRSLSSSESSLASSIESAPSTEPNCGQGQGSVASVRRASCSYELEKRNLPNFSPKPP